MAPAGVDQLSMRYSLSVTTTTAMAALMALLLSRLPPAIAKWCFRAIVFGGILLYSAAAPQRRRLGFACAERRNGEGRRQWLAVRAHHDVDGKDPAGRAYSMD